MILKIFLIFISLMLMFGAIAGGAVYEEKRREGWARFALFIGLVSIGCAFAAGAV